MVEELVIKLTIQKQLYEQLLNKYPQFKGLKKATAIRLILQNLVQGTL